MIIDTKLETITYGWELLLVEFEPAVRLGPAVEELAIDSGASQESKCISIAISKFPLQASSKDLAMSLEAPVTLTNWEIRLADIFVLAAILNWPLTKRARETVSSPGRKVENCRDKFWVQIFLQKANHNS